MYNGLREIFARQSFERESDLFTFYGSNTATCPGIFRPSPGGTEDTSTTIRSIEVPPCNGQALESAPQPG